MGLQKPIENVLTQEQEKLLSQLSSINNVFSVKLNSPKFLQPNQQISTFDYLKKITEVTLGKAAMEGFLSLFISKIFDPATDKLERIILKSMAKSLDANGKTISSTQSNQAWLLQYALPPMHIAFRVTKAEIAKQIITMVFGPKEKMSSNPVKQDELLNAAVCSSDMFSVSNPVSNSNGDIEFNKVDLQQKLSAGNVVFTISCQDVKISLPDSILAQADNVISNNSNLSKPAINPSVMFDQVNSYVNTETQRINTPENANSVSRSFAEIMIGKIINLSVTAIGPQLQSVLNTVANNPNGNPNLGITVDVLVPTPCDIRASSTLDSPQDFAKKSSFLNAMMNSLYAYLLSVILQKLISEIKLLIKKYLVKKAQDAVRRKLAKKQYVSDEQLQKLEGAQKFAQATASLNDIFKFEGIS